MRELIISMDCNCCKIEIFFPSLSKEQMELMVQFLYSGKIKDLNLHGSIISEVGLVSKE